MLSFLRTRFGQKLYLQIWLAIVLALVLVWVLSMGLWHWERAQQIHQRPGREITLLNKEGEVLGRANGLVHKLPGQGPVIQIDTPDGQTLYLQLHRPGGGPPPMGGKPGGRTPFDTTWLLLVLIAGVALGTYPVVRRLTKRLERLQIGVQKWGEGALHTRLDMPGHDEVASLARNFNQAADRVEQLLKSHKRLLANASHEIRSPLTRIRMSLELMDHRPMALTQEEIKRNISELDQLTEEILLASRLDANPQDLGTCEPIDLVGLCAESCAHDGASFRLEPPCESAEIAGVHKLLRRALRNLIENAHRYGDGQVEVVLCAVPQGFAVQVMDSGSGVPEAQREAVFEPFYRLSAASERSGGVGLGLALVRSIAQQHGGKAYCTANPAGGACFVLQLPSSPLVG